MDKKYLNEDLTILNSYFRDIKKCKLLTSEEEVELAVRIQNGDELAIQELVQANLRFVVSIAKSYADNSSVKLSDLISEGNFGLVKAATRFDPTRGFKFISYAVWWIKQSMLQYLHDHSRTIRLPVNILTKLYQLKRELKDVDLDTQNISKENFEFLNKYPLCSSVNSVINEDGDELCDILEDSPVVGYEELRSDDDEVKGNILECLDILEVRERDILIYYYGLMDSEETMTLEMIGDKYGLTKERVRQIKSRAIKKLRANIPAILKLSN